MRVLAIAQRLAEFARESAAARRFFHTVLLQLAREPVGHGGVVGRGARESALRQLATKRAGGRTIVRVHFVQHGFVILHIDHDRHPIMVLRGGARHRRATDVDLLDGVLEAGAFGDGLFERIKIGHQQIDAFDLVQPHGLGVVGLIAQREQPTMHLGMQRFHPPIHHFGKARDFGNVGDFQPRIAQRLRRTTGGDQHHAMAIQPLGEVDQAGLVENRKQRAADGAERHGDSWGWRVSPAHIARPAKREASD